MFFDWLKAIAIAIVGGLLLGYLLALWVSYA